MAAFLRKRHHRLFLPALFTAAVLVFTVFMPVCSARYSDRVVRVGWYDQPGYQNLDADGAYSGYTYEYLQSIAQYTGWTYEFVDGQLSDLYAMLVSGQIDVMGTLVRSDTRSAECMCTDIQEGTVSSTLFVRADSPIAAGDLSMLSGITAGVRAGQNSEALHSFAANNGISITQKIYASYEDICAAVASGEVAAGSVGGYYADERFKAVAEFSQLPIYFYVSKGSKEVLEGFNSAMAYITQFNPYYDRDLQQKYIPNAVQAYGLTAEETDYVASRGFLKVLCSDNHYPVEYFEDGIYKGIIADIYAQISKHTGLGFEFVSSLPEGESADIISAVDLNYDTECADKYSLTGSIIKMPLVSVGPSVSNGTGKVAYLGVFNEGTIERKVEKRAIAYDTPEQCFAALRQGEVDNVIINSYSAKALLSESRNSRFESVFLQGLNLDVAAAVSADSDPRLFIILNKAIAGISESDKNDIILANSLGHDDIGLIEAVNRLPSILTAAFALLLLLVIGALILIIRVKARSNKTVERLLYNDQLTGLYNQRGFEREVAKLVTKESHGRVQAVVAFDVNSFEMYNSLNGFTAGDGLLKAVAEVLKKEAVGEERYARYTADNYAGYLISGNLETLIRHVEKLDERLRAAVNDKSILFTFGIRVIEDKSAPVTLMYDRAVIAKRGAKGNYDSNIAIYDDKLYHGQNEDTELVRAMNGALENEEFKTYYQPKYDANTCEIAGAEALVRWIKPDGLIIPPGRFIELFERNGVISRLDKYMFESVCSEIASMRRRGIIPVPVSVNFSRAHLFDVDFAKSLFDVTDRYQIPTSLIEIELTESAFIDNQGTLVRIIDDLHKYGFSVSIDDFGSGYSSLNMLKDVSFDVMKIDRAFITSSSDSGRGANVVKGVVLLAKSLGLKIVAEGVETEEQLLMMRSLGCDLIQGFYFSKPVPGDEYAEKLASRNGGTK